MPNQTNSTKKKTQKKTQPTSQDKKIKYIGEREVVCYTEFLHPFNAAQVTEGWQDTVSALRRDDPKLAQDLVLPWGGTWGTISSAWEGLDRTPSLYTHYQAGSSLLRTGIYEAYLSKMRNVWLQPCSPFSLAHSSNLNHTN